MRSLLCVAAAVMVAWAGEARAEGDDPKALGAQKKQIMEQVKKIEVSSAEIAELKAKVEAGEALDEEAKQKLLSIMEFARLSKEALEIDNRIAAMRKKGGAKKEGGKKEGGKKKGGEGEEGGMGGGE